MTSGIKKILKVLNNKRKEKRLLPIEELIGLVKRIEARDISAEEASEVIRVYSMLTNLYSDEERKRIEEMRDIVYDYIADLVLQYRASSGSMQDELLLHMVTLYSWLLNMLCDLIYTDNYVYMDSNNYHRRFINTFKGKNSNNSTATTYTYATILCKRMFTRDEFVVTSCITLINAMNSCKEPELFMHYMNKVYVIRLAQRIISEANDIMAHQKFIALDTNNIDTADNKLVAHSEYIRTQHDPLIQAIHVNKLFMIAPGSQLDSNWVRGLTCDEAFKCLSTCERYELKLRTECFDNINISKRLGKWQPRMSKTKSFERIASKVSRNSRHKHYKPLRCRCGNIIYRRIKEKTIERCDRCEKRNKDSKTAERNSKDRVYKKWFL